MEKAQRAKIHSLIRDMKIYRFNNFAKNGFLGSERSFFWDSFRNAITETSAAIFRRGLVRRKNGYDRNTFASFVYQRVFGLGEGMLISTTTSDFQP